MSLKYQKKIGHNINVTIQRARNNDTTAFTWEVNWLSIEKSELNLRRILQASQEKKDYIPKSTRIFFNEIGIELNTKMIAATIKAHTNIPRIRSFFIRFVNSIAWSNKQYFRYKRVDSPRCQYCNGQEQGRYHFFICLQTVDLYRNIFPSLPDPLKGITSWLRGEYNQGKLFIIGSLVYFTYRQNLAREQLKCENFFVWLNKIKLIKSEIASKNDKMEKTCSKWDEIENELK